MSFQKFGVSRKRPHTDIVSEHKLDLGPPLYQSAFDTADELSLEEFEEYGLKRLRVLQGFAESRPDAWERYEWKYSQYRDKDVASHFILLLAYCKTEEQRRWFVQQESAMMRQRLRESVLSLDYLKANGFNFASPDPHLFEEKERFLQALRPQLHLPRVTEYRFDHKEYFLVPFQDVLDLIRKREVYLSRGMAFLHKSQLVTLVLSRFRQILIKHLVDTNKALPLIESDERLRPILAKLRSIQNVATHSGADYAAGGVHGVVTLRDLPFAQESFPPCMRTLYEQLKATNHLKHGARIQLGFFFKGIGLSMEDSLTLFRSHFSKVFHIGPDKFDKQYAYTIRHNYGKEGHGHDYRPFSCMRIITNPPGAQETHGCPFQVMQEDALDGLMSRMSIRGADSTGNSYRERIKTLARDKHYQLACACTFNSLHTGAPDEPVTHPNNWFDRSMTHRKSKMIATDEAEENGAASSAPMPN
eukprot:TRINITY_DN7950_c0_g1::TRINITY_DN7950_c0_g1_i1::g.15488::m.15488 TRINITY_DN7950_c0_g1::TRINITY_DN7950_c0_g1_i1::g.15488  ORF type:complete len:473 (-),score=55.14,sp/Q84WJ2/PRI2_ARATH/37.02/2e-89,DNA_primase_lrg/PF04104.9/1.9e-66 TRINITY_DN7950_c0_g1_i1:87-1505(-)